LSVPTSQTHSSQQTREPYFYNGRDINVGDYIFDTGNGAILKIYSISFKDETTVTCVVEDFDRVNIFQNPDQDGSGKIPDGDGYVFEVHDGLPILFPVPDSLVGLVSQNFASNIISRFFYRKDYALISVDQTAHGLSIGDAIYLDATGYHKAQSNSPSTSEVIGYVTEVGYQASQTVPPLTPDRFRYRSIGPMVILGAGIIPAGNPGIPIYLSDSVAGGLTTAKPANPVKVFIKIDSTTAILTNGGQGEMGPQGPIGVQGVAGADGADGVQGVAGADGADGSIGPQGLTGSGVQGVAGADGADGVQGAAGADGSIGPQGLTGVGVQGVAGADGSIGPQGLTGVGVQGVAGADGSIGPQGLTGVGVQGVAGADGSIGPQGLTGSGVQGVAGADGSIGPQGLTGSGVQGVAGANGADGSIGPQGLTGSGVQGVAGADGSIGPQGLTGSGVQGAVGPQGLTGTGVQGAQGPAGTTSNYLYAKTFTINYTTAGGAHPQTVTNLPSGWGYSINTDAITITHTEGKLVMQVFYWGYNAATPTNINWRYPTSTNTMTVPSANTTTTFILNIASSSATGAGTTDGSYATVYCYFLS
jgi:hypothetical protein